MVATLTGIGTQAATTAFRIGNDKINEWTSKSIDVRVHLIDKASSLSVPGAVITLRDPDGSSIIGSATTNQFGIASFKVSALYGPYLLDLHYKYGNIDYSHPRMVTLSQAFLSQEVEFDPQNWGRAGEPAVATAASTPPTLVPASEIPKVLPAVTKGPAWLGTAFAELGTRVGPNEPLPPRIIDYWKSVPSINAVDRKDVFWPSPFVEWVLNQNNITGPKSGASQSWLRWGEAIETPRPGCVAVFWTNSPNSGAGFVGFYLNSSGGKITVIGGSVSSSDGAHSVEVATLSTDRFLGCRWPTGA